jgi:hypothetical protein
VVQAFLKKWCKESEKVIGDTEEDKMLLMMRKEK